MDPAERQAAERFAAGEPVAVAALAHLLDFCADRPEVSLRTGVSQIALRRRRGFAWLWRPRQYLGPQAAPAVLAIALDRPDPSPRWKEVAHPSPQHWIHHLELPEGSEAAIGAVIDAEVLGWLEEAYRAADDSGSSSSRSAR